MIKLHSISIAANLLLLVISLAIPWYVHAEEQELTATEVIHVMPKVTVVSTSTDTLTSTEIIDHELIEKIPSSNGNVTELLDIIPGVQFPENYRNSVQAGEIRPPQISISGSRTSDNQFLFDGSSNNSLLDHNHTELESTSDLPGHSQKLFLLEHLVEKITVFRANIPARYGSFTGGVIDVNSIDPDCKYKGSLSLRGTRSAWGQFYISPDQEDAFYNSNSSDYQPDYKKYQSNATFHVPLNDATGVVFDYSRLESIIPFRTSFDQEQKQKRISENFFLKSLTNFPSGTELRLSATYAPYHGEHNLSTAINSDFTLTEGGYKLNTNLNKPTKLGLFEWILDYQSSERSREARNIFYSWRNKSSKDWGTNSFSNEGGFGDLEQKEQSFATALHFTSEPQSLGQTENIFSFGTEINHSQASHNRTEDLIVYLARLADDSNLTLYPIIPCPPGDDLCIDGEQFMYSKTETSAYKADAETTNIEAYFEDQLKVNRLAVRPGVRISYEDFQENLNIAPRFSASYDLFDDSQTIITGGYNRYYGSNLLSLALESQQSQWVRSYRCEINPATNKCIANSYDPNEPWRVVPRTTFTKGRISDLKTPYSDEFTVGVQQSFLAGNLELLYINREYKDQIITVELDRDDDGITYYEWDNSGRRTHDEISLSWDRSWQKHFFSCNITWQETKSNSSTVSDKFDIHQEGSDPDELDLPVWYKLELIDKSQLPLNDFNRPYRASLVYSTSLPFNFTFTNTTNYRSRYQIIEKVTSGDVPTPDGSIVDVDTLDNDYYQDKTVHSSLLFDWKIAWQSDLWRGNAISFTLEILNVFNRKVEIGTTEDGFLLGRQYWAGMTYKF